MKHEERAPGPWLLVLVLSLGFSLPAPAVTPDEGDEVYGSWVVLDLENSGMRILTTMTIRPDRIEVSSRCSYGDKKVEAGVSSEAQITHREITVLETKYEVKEYSPGFLQCRAAISPMSVTYRLDGGKLIISVPGKDETHEMTRASAN